MLLNAVILCCMIAVNAEPPLNSYSFTGDGNGYDYSNSVTNNAYLGSKDSYIGDFYGDTNRKLSNHIGSHSIINTGNQQDDIGGDVANSYNGYSANDRGGEYSNNARYSNTYENSDRDSSYVLATHATPTSFRGYSGHNNRGKSVFGAYSSGSVQQDSDFGQYSSSNNKRVPAYSGYSRPTVLEQYSEDSADSEAQGYHDSSDVAGYSDGDQAYSPYSSVGAPTNEYSHAFGKQKASPYNFKGRNKYDDVYSTISETRYVRGNANQNRDIPSYLSDSRPSQNFFKTHGVSYTSGKPNKYGYKSRYTPTSGVNYLLRERNAYYTPYGKSNGKIVIIKDSRSSYIDNAGYRSKNGGFIGGYSTSSNFDGHGGANGNFDDGPTMPRRYRYATPIVVAKTIYS